MEASGDGACLHVKDVSNVSQWSVFIVVELQKCLFFGLQLGDGIAEVIDAALVVECFIHLCVCQIGSVLDVDVLDALLAKPRDGGVVGDTANPCGERRVTDEGVFEECRFGVAWPSYLGGLLFTCR